MLKDFTEKNLRRRWLMLLSDSEDSNWGSVDAFYADIDRRRSRQKATDTFDINFKPWGKFVRRDMKPAPGDGFAFYHTTRALFERSDPHRRKARISLIGNLKDIRQIPWFSSWIRWLAQNCVQRQLKEDSPKSNCRCTQNWMHFNTCPRSLRLVGRSGRA